MYECSEVNAGRQVGLGPISSFFYLLFEQVAMDMANPTEKKADLSDIDTCVSYLKALGDPIRLKIVRALRAGALSVTDISLLLEADVPNVSHHLRVLFHADIVSTEREGKFVYYRLNEEFLCNRGGNKALDFGCCQIDLPN